MTHENLRKADKKTFYFIGVTTSKSSIMKVFPKWAEYLGFHGTPIVGIDCKIHDEKEVYRKIVSFLKHDELSLGGLVTTHKMDILSAARDLFDYVDPYSDMLGEISSISKLDGKFCGHAKDPYTSGYALYSFIDDSHWQKDGALCILGAGGSSLALTAYIMNNKTKEQSPKKICVINRSVPRLEHMKKIHNVINKTIEVEYIHAPETQDADNIVSNLPPHSVIVNATGLGKDMPGSPLSDSVIFPENSIIWEFNYRGDLLFMHQAEMQKEKRNLTIEDGWTYFVHGWTQVIAEVFHVEIVPNGDKFNEMSKIASAIR